MKESKPKLKVKQNNIFAFETDTVWGMGCLPNDIDAVNHIYEIKNRDRSKPLILMSNDIKYLIPYVQDIPLCAQNLIDKHWPGALTIILKKSNLCADYLTSGFNTVGLRIPNHNGFWDLCKSVEGHVLATTSLNISTEPPCADYCEAQEKFSHLCTVIKPDKVKKIQGNASTVIVCVDDDVKILRQGNIII